MSTYRVIAGKHNVGENEYVRQGETLELSTEEAAKFPNKFELVDAVNVPVAEAAVKNEGKGAQGTSPTSKSPEGKKVPEARAPGVLVAPKVPTQPVVTPAVPVTPVTPVVVG